MRLPTGLAADLSALSPDLVIIALGTNEAFGRISVETLQNNIDVLLSTIRAHSPEAKILLVGPTECYRKVYRRRKGRRRTSSTVVNTKTADIARASSGNMPNARAFHTTITMPWPVARRK